MQRLQGKPEAKEFVALLEPIMVSSAGCAAQDTFVIK
jgi:hypothetical protein